MKKHFQKIPYKERVRNAERVYKHEQNLEEIQFKRMCKEKFEEKHSAHETDKDREAEEVYARLQALAERSGNDGA